jgi:hypothetical protein
MKEPSGVASQNFLYKQHCDPIPPAVRQSSRPAGNGSVLEETVDTNPLPDSPSQSGTPVPNNS